MVSSHVASGLDSAGHFQTPSGVTIDPDNQTAFCVAVEALKQQAVDTLGEADLRHLRKIETRGRVAAVLGYATAWIFPNPLTVLLLTSGQATRWLLAHHILHRGYDKVPGVPERYTSKYFAKGWRRYIDWFDWIHPQAWSHEHNILHHYHTGEDKDPDLLERHIEFMRQSRIPRIFKYLFLAIAGLTWKFTYYAPNTISTIDPEHGKPIKHENLAFITVLNIFNLRNKHVRKLWTACYLPYTIVNFVLIPSLFLPLGTTAALFVLINKLLAEGLTNLHSFTVVGPSHTASDLCRFDYHFSGKEQFYVHQVLGSANYRTGGDVRDHLHCWLNYQIEHHLFPDLPMLKYQEIQPEVKRLCEEHGIPYIQESVFVRLKKMTDVCVGKSTMMDLKAFPAAASEQGTVPVPTYEEHQGAAV